MVYCYKQLQKALHKDYLVELKKACLGLAKKALKETFNHVISKYAKTTILMQKENWWEFEQPINPDKLFAVYTKCQDKCQSIAANDI